jgi:fibronectin type 3 domain-containing protein
LATGRGSPVANFLIPYLASYGGSSSSSGGTTTTTTVPTTPTNFSVQTVSTSEIDLSWSASSGATGYNIYELESGQAVLIGSVGSSATSFAIGNLAAATTYSFEVAATNSAGSAATGWVQATTLAPSATVTAPTGVTATAASSTVARVSWNATSGATGYIVYEWNGLQAVQVARVAAGTTAVDVGGQSPGATEYFYVTAYNSTSSASSNWVSIVMPTPPAVTAPANVTASATSSTTGTLSWGASANATGYAIYYWNGFQSVLLGTVASGTTSVTIQGLSPGSTNYFAVVAYNGTSSAASSWVAITTPVSSAARAADTLFAQPTDQMWWW